MRRIACCLLLVVVALSASSTAAADAANAWTTTGPPTAVEQSIAVSAFSPGTVYTGDSAGGVWRSRDDGVTWANVSPADSSTRTNPVWALAISPSDADKVIATRGCHIYVSSDGGDTWQTPSSVPFTQFCQNAFSVSFDASGVAWTLTGGGLYSSSDGGATWMLAGSPPNGAGAGVLTIAPGSPQVIWVGAKNGTVATSSDGGVTRRSGPATGPRS